MKKRTRRIGATAVTIAGAALTVALATGSVAFVTTHGVSMLPRFHTGDLAVIAPASEYHVGDVVGYHSPLLHIVVLHRIVGVHDGLFTFKGDNNSFLDPVHLPASAIAGKLWLRVPHAGVLLSWFHTPVAIAALAASVVGVGSAEAAARRRRARQRRQSGPSTRPARDGGRRVPAHAALSHAPVSTGADRPALPPDQLLRLAGAWFAVAVLGLVSFYTWTRPSTRPTTRLVPYGQTVDFSYSASAPAGATYPTGRVTTGTPVFTRLVDQLDVRAAYALSATGHRPSNLSGTMSATASLIGPGGWAATLATTGPVRFTNGKAAVDLPVDLTRIAALESQFATETGNALGTTDVIIATTVRARGRLGGAGLSASFSPQLVMQLSAQELSLISATPVGTPPSYPQLHATSSGSVGTAATAPAKLAIGGHSLPVGVARVLATLLFVVALACAALLHHRSGRRLRLDEPQWIRANYRHELVPVESTPVDDRRLQVEVDGFEALLRLARRYDSMVLEQSVGTEVHYFVESGSTLYRYTAHRHTSHRHSLHLHLAERRPSRGSSSRGAVAPVAGLHDVEEVGARLESLIATVTTPDTETDTQSGTDADTGTAATPSGIVWYDAADPEVGHDTAPPADIAPPVDAVVDDPLAEGTIVPLPVVPDPAPEYAGTAIDDDDDVTASEPDEAPLSAEESLQALHDRLALLVAEDPADEDVAAPETESLEELHDRLFRLVHGPEEAAVSHEEALHHSAEESTPFAL
ncbi:MAG TPA: signal peptidase I [Acidimicrobiales bacterium]|nr:signal peptidase I [Acidimicrobiales bacterium]